MSLFKKEDLANIKQDEQFLEELVGHLFNNKRKWVDSLAGDVAEFLAEDLKENVEFQGKIKKAMCKDSLFKQKMIDKLINEIT